MSRTSSAFKRDLKWRVRYLRTTGWRNQLRPYLRGLFSRYKLRGNWITWCLNGQNGWIRIHHWRLRWNPWQFRNMRWRFSDWMHRRFKHRRSWHHRKGWVFKFGPIKITTYDGRSR
jgi:hypothetical protein